MTKRAIALALFLTTISAIAQTVTLNDASTIVASPYRIGMNIGDVCWYSNCNMLKNIVGNNNPNFEPMEDRRIWVVDSTGTTTSFTGPINYDNYPPNYFVGAQYNVISVQASGAELGCTGLVTSNTNANWPSGGSTNPTFTLGTACGAALGVGDIIIVQCSPTVHCSTLNPTPNSDWGNNYNGVVSALSGGGLLTTDTTDLCATCGSQALTLDATVGSAGIIQYWDSDTNDIWVMINGTYQISFWAKIKSGTPTLTITGSRSVGSGGFACGPFTPTITGSWAQYTINCTGAETQGATPPGIAGIYWTATNGAIYIDNLSFQKTGTDPTNTSVWRDEIINDLKLLHPGTLRYWITNQNGLSIDNWTRPSTQRSASNSGTRAYGQPAITGRMMPSLEEYLVICQLIGAEPYIEMPVTWLAADFKNFIEFLAGDGTTVYGTRRINLGQTAAWTTVFNTIHLDFCNECWNSTFAGEALPIRASAPSSVTPAYNGIYWDYAHAMYLSFAAIRTDAFYNPAKFELIANAQTAQTYGWDYFLSSAPANSAPDTIEVAAYYYSTVNQFSTDLQTWQPEFVTPFERTVNASDPLNFNQSLTDYLAQTTCGAAGNVTCRTNVYEWGAGTEAGSVSQTVQDYLDAGSGDIIPTALLPLLNMQHWPVIGPQNRFSFNEYTNGGVNANTAKLWGAIVDAGGATNNVRPAFQAIQLVNQSIIGTMFSCPVGSGNTFNFTANTNNGDAVPPGTPATANVPLVYAYCFKSGTQRSLVLINSDVSAAHTVTFAGTNTPTGTVTTRQIAPSSMNLLNEAHSGSATNTTAMATSLTSASGAASSTINLPAFSVTTLDYSLSSSVTTTGINGTVSIAGSVIIR